MKLAALRLVAAIIAMTGGSVDPPAWRRSAHRRHRNGDRVPDDARWHDENAAGHDGPHDGAAVDVARKRDRAPLGTTPTAAVRSAASRCSHVPTVPFNVAVSPDTVTVMCRVVVQPLLRVFRRRAGRDLLKTSGSEDFRATGGAEPSLHSRSASNREVERTSGRVGHASVGLTTKPRGRHRVVDCHRASLPAVLIASRICSRK